MHPDDDYENMITGKNLYCDLYHKDFRNRMEYARDCGCNSVILTGDTEPQQNWDFLKQFGEFNQSLKSPFKNIAIQTSGTMLDDHYLYFLRHHVGVTTIALSVADLFNNESNFDIQQTPEKLRFNINRLCERIKKYRFNLRLCLNMSDVYNDVPADIFFQTANFAGANQLTFRMLYTSGTDSEQDKWIESHQYTGMQDIIKYIKDNGKLIRVLEYGQLCYSVNGISTVVDDDCMSQTAKKDLKYLILRPDCKLYSQWDDKGSLIF
jgi:hypothetical protein